MIHNRTCSLYALWLNAVAGVVRRLGCRVAVSDNNVGADAVNAEQQRRGKQHWRYLRQAAAHRSWSQIGSRRVQCSGMIVREVLIMNMVVVERHRWHATLSPAVAAVVGRCEAVFAGFREGGSKWRTQNNKLPA